MSSLIRMGLRSLIRTASAADDPPSGQRGLFARSDGWYDRVSAGTEVRLLDTSTGVDMVSTQASIGGIKTFTSKVNFSGGVGLNSSVSQSGVLDFTGDNTGATAGTPLKSVQSWRFYTRYWDGSASQTELATFTVVRASVTPGDHYFSFGAPVRATQVFDNGSRVYSPSNPPPSSGGPPAAKVASTGNLTLSGAQTIDGVAVVAGDIVLAKDQTTASQNGPYTVAAGAWARTPGYDTATGLAGLSVAVQSGTVNGGSIYHTNFKSTDTVGTTAMTWAEDYSDLNPPQTLRQTVLATSPAATPPAGTSDMFTVDGVALWLKDSTGYVSKIGSLSVRAVATTNISGSGPQTIDGVALVAGDRVLLTGQTTAANNGVYDVAAGAWTRTAGYETARGIASTDLVTCREGTVNGGTVWTTSFKATNTLGTTAQAWFRLVDFSAMTKANVGLGNVDNTADIDKPISTDTQVALNGKAASNILSASGRRGTPAVTVSTANTNATAPVTFSSAMSGTPTIVTGLFASSALGRTTAMSAPSSTGFTQSVAASGTAAFNTHYLAFTGLP